MATKFEIDKETGAVMPSSATFEKMTGREVDQFEAYLNEHWTEEGTPPALTVVPDLDMLSREALLLQMTLRFIESRTSVMDAREEFDAAVEGALDDINWVRSPSWLVDNSHEDLESGMVSTVDAASELSRTARDLQFAVNEYTWWRNYITELLPLI